MSQPPRFAPTRIARPLIGPALFACVALATPPATHAQAGDSAAVRELAPGVTYQRITDAAGPWVMHVVRVRLRQPGVELRVARAHDQLRGRESTTAMARRLTNGADTVLAAVNADFFQLSSGENENNQVIDGEWWKGLQLTDSPYDTYDNVHIQFAMDARRHPYMERFVLDGRAWVKGVPTPILGVNFNPSGKPEGTALYTWRYGATTPRDTTRLTAEAALASVGRRGDTLLYVRRGPVSSASGSVIPNDGAVLAAYGAGLRTREVQAMADGDTVRLLLVPRPRLAAGASPSFIVGGWPRILRDGANVAPDAPTAEGTISRNAEMRHPRTAVGFSRDSATLVLLSVEGRSARSAGMTTSELAVAMLRFGAWQAMNFDGGGSTSMVIDGALVNVSSDPAGEREVGNALLVLKRRSRTAP